ncbi:hypothetical protein LY76DRAFT_586779 [Colletotrichum caudatum]|nr:hypothetical protein LY76DRAFT_586779 [Colletotrichum caudatum]
MYDPPRRKPPGSDFDFFPRLDYRHHRKPPGKRKPPRPLPLSPLPPCVTRAPGRKRTNHQPKYYCVAALELASKPWAGHTHTRRGFPRARHHVPSLSRTPSVWMAD